jgi:outer membrane protein W
VRPALRAALAAALLALGGARAVHAQVAVAVDGGYFTMTNARNSAEAVFGGSGGGFTGGAEVTFGLSRSFFIGAGGRFFQKTGERVFVADADSPVFRLGHPLKIRTIPLYGLLGFHFTPDSKFDPYVSTGAGVTLYKEESTVAEITETNSQTKFSGFVALGADYGRGSVRFGVEANYSFVPSTIGLGGVSAIYGEKDVGGFAILGRIVFGGPR